MGLPLPTTANPAVSNLPAGDQANQGLTGSFTAVGQASQPFCLYGAFNVSMYGGATVSIITGSNTTKATINDSGTALSAGTVAAGLNVNSTAVPPGTTIASAPFSSMSVGGMTTVTLGALSTSQIATLAVATTSAILIGNGIEPTATIQLQRSFDGGSTWIPAGIGGGGQPAEYSFGGSGITNGVSFTASEPEKQVAYRLCVTAWTSGVPLYYRISASGLAAMAWGIQNG